MKRITALLLLVFAFQADAREIEKVKFDDTVTVGAQTLVLNGTGLRVKRKLGMGFKVYVAGLYGVRASSDPKVWLDGKDTQVLDLVFLRGVDRGTLAEAWREGFEKNCAQVEACGEKDSLRSFNDMMVDSKDGGRLHLVLSSSGVDVSMDGKTKSQGKVEGAGFRKALLAIFIGGAPPTEDLKKGLLGL